MRASLVTRDSISVSNTVESHYDSIMRASFLLRVRALEFTFALFVLIWRRAFINESKVSVEVGHLLVLER